MSDPELTETQVSVLGKLCRLPIGWKITYDNLCVVDGPTSGQTIRRTSALGVLGLRGLAVEVDPNVFEPTEAGRALWAEMNA